MDPSMGIRPLELNVYVNISKRFSMSHLFHNDNRKEDCIITSLKRYNPIRIFNFSLKGSFNVNKSNSNLFIQRVWFTKFYRIITDFKGFQNYQLSLKWNFFGMWWNRNSPTISSSLIFPVSLLIAFIHIIIQFNYDLE